MDDKLLRLARKINSIDNELKELSQVKNFKGLMFVNNELDKYKKFTNDVVTTYEDFINITQKEMSKEINVIKEQGNKLSNTGKENKKELDNKINKIKEDVITIYSSINNSIEKIQKDILETIDKQVKEINNNSNLKNKELSEIKKENLILKANIQNLEEMFNKLELQKGDTGKSAYEIACELGFEGTVEEWIKSLHGKDGKEVELRGMRAFSDAPKDNKIYARQNKKWVEVSSGGGGTSDYTELSNKPKINNVELSGNKSLSDLGINIPDVSNFITNDVDDLTYYYTKTEVDGKVSSVYKYKGSVETYSDLPNTDLTVGDVYNVETDGSNYAWTGSEWDKLGGTVDLSGYQTKIDSSHKLSSDLVDDTNKTNKFVTAQEKTTWNNKSDFSGNYNDLSNKPTIPSEVTETTVSNWGFTKNTGTYSKPSGRNP